LWLELAVPLALTDLFAKSLKKREQRCVIDLKANPYFKGDLADKETLERFAGTVIADHGHVDCLLRYAASRSIGITMAPMRTSDTLWRLGLWCRFIYQND